MKWSGRNDGGTCAQRRRSAWLQPPARLLSNPARQMDDPDPIVEQARIPLRAFYCVATPDGALLMDTLILALITVKRGASIPCEAVAVVDLTI